MVMVPDPRSNDGEADTESNDENADDNVSDLGPDNNDPDIRADDRQLLRALHVPTVLQEQDDNTNTVVRGRSG